VEDWTIQNQAEENHEFHMHQIHFLLLAVNGVPVKPDQQQLYDGSPSICAPARPAMAKLQGQPLWQLDDQHSHRGAPPMTRRVTHGSTPTRRFSR
jgi:FtsP/CotA-like multicopper oxidase with cupredoxin domain